MARPVHWNIGLIERFMLIMGPVSTLFDLITFGVLIFIFRAGMIEFRTGWFVESLVTQLLMIFSVRTRHRPFASRPHPLVTSFAFGITALTLAPPSLRPAVGLGLPRPQSLTSAFFFWPWQDSSS